jgi:hypothetical protein
MAFGIPILDAVLDGVSTALEKIFPDQNVLVQAKAEIEKELLINRRQQLEQLLQAQKDVLLTELQSQSWISRNWRALLMVSLSFVVVSNYAIMPYLQAFTGIAVIVDLPEFLYYILLAGMLGYLMNTDMLKAIFESIGKRKNGRQP